MKMVHFPKRKCYQVAKICVTLVLVLTFMSLFEYWRGGKRGSEAYNSMAYLDPEEMEYERQIREDEARIVPGLGEGGAAVHFTGMEEKLGQESEKKLAMNVYLSDRIPYNRSLIDHRNPACQRVVYDAELPSVSVVIIFHNEPYSVVIRTIWSVINSARRDNPWYRQANHIDRATGRTMNLGYPNQDPASPLVYLKEIILVDDNSTLPELKGKLSHYIRTRMPAGLIRILRLPDRVGLTRARLAGARYASSDAIIFLDAHCETQPDWLRPLLQRMKEDPHAVVMPIIDVIEATDFYYSVQDPTSFQVGGFNFMGHFTWIDVNEREKKRRGSDIAPTWSPTMAGGLFAINRDYYWELGAYDEQMAGWGGENLEMSFRIWQCGGTLETVPCSRVGHVFRSFHPYGMPATTDTHGINTARMAEVWMDDYKELYYIHRPDLRNNPKIGDVTHRKILREKLHCKDFQWYLDNIYPEKFVPVRDAYGFGRFKNPHTGLCLDSLQRENDASPLGVYPCHGSLQPTQYFALAQNRLRDEERCTVGEHTSSSRSQQDGAGFKLLMMSCRPSQQGEKWRYMPSKQLQHEASGHCLDAGWEAGADVKAKPCKPNAPTQIWQIDYTEDNGFRLNPEGPPSELELKLQKLRGQRPLRRIGRSLMGARGGARPPATTEGAKRRRTHKKKHRRSKKHSRSGRSKNRFILKLVRTGPNGSAQHLEVDVHCRHDKLLPNNTFVRDLVALLTDHDIKVINNGRVFERNKVTELANSDVARSGPTLAPSTQPTVPPVPISVQPKLWSKRERERKRLPPPSLVPAPALRTSPPRSSPYRQTDNKIIIEDFVQVGNSDTASMVEPKYKRKPHVRVPPRLAAREHPPSDAPLAPLAPLHAARNRVRVPPEDEPEESPLNEESHLNAEESHLNAEESPLNMQTSVEDTPMISNDPVNAEPVNSEPVIAEPVVDGEPVVARSSMESKRVGNKVESGEMLNSDNEEWFMDGPHFRTNGTRVRAAEIDNNHIDEPPRVSTTPALLPHEVRHRAAGTRHKQSPLRVVMKSNLTFNLGDELLGRRAQDDVNNLLDDLTQPASPSPAAPPAPPAAPLIQTPVPDRGDQGDSDSNSSGSSSSQE